MERTGTVPSFMVMALSEDHTKGTRPGVCTPKACVASNDLGIGKIVEAVSASSLWKEFAIFIIEDDAQNGPDHVDSHRTVGLVVSPYTRNTGVDHTHYTTTSMLRTMELILGATPMSQFDAAATPMYAAFHDGPDVTPYHSRTPATDLDAKNPPAKEPPLLARSTTRSRISSRWRRRSHSIKRFGARSKATPHIPAPCGDSVRRRPQTMTTMTTGRPLAHGDR